MLTVAFTRKLRILTGAVLIAAAAATIALGQAPVPVYGDGPIPKAPFTSWSLFLMCNPKWLTAKQAPALKDVFDAYVAFARTSGHQHAGVWFIKKNGIWQNPDDLDVDRSVEYCRKFRLVPSEGPHVVVVTTHPDKWEADASKGSSQSNAIVILALGGSETRDIVTLLGKLNDQIAIEKLSQQELKSKQYWLSWIRVLENGCKLLDNVKFTVSAKFVKVEKKGVCKSDG